MPVTAVPYRQFFPVSAKFPLKKKPFDVGGLIVAVLPKCGGRQGKSLWWMGLGVSVFWLRALQRMRLGFWVFRYVPTAGDGGEKPVVGVIVEKEMGMCCGDGDGARTSPRERKPKRSEVCDL